MTAFGRRPLAPRGNRPYETGEPHAERVLAIAMAIAADVAALHERVDTLMRVAGRGVPFTPADLEAYVPSPDVVAERDGWREAYLARLLRIMHEMVPVEAGAQERDYAAFVEEISSPAKGSEASQTEGNPPCS